MKVKLIALMIILSFIVPIIPIVGMPQVSAAKGEQQPPQEPEIITPSLKEKLETMSPADNISVIVYLRRDPSLDQQIQAIWQGQPDDEMHTLSESLMQKYRNVYQELGPSAVEQLRKGDAATTERYRELKEKYGLTEEFTRTTVQRLTELNDAKGEQVYSLHVQAYTDMQIQAKQRIEQLPDTKVTASIIMDNSLGVETKVSNIEALTTVPDIVMIANSPSGMPAISTHFDLVPLAPADGSTGRSVKQISFLWTPAKEATKYQFILAEDAAMTQIVKEAEVTDINYDYDGPLDYNTIYFWRIMATEPASSDWSATFSFQTETAPSTTEMPSQNSSLNIFIILGLAVAIAGISTLVILFLTKRKTIKA